MTDFPTSLLFDDARDLLRKVAASHRLPIEHVALARAHGRVLAEDIVAPIALQPFDNSAMDGYACRHADLCEGDGVSLTLVGEQFAGRTLGLQVGEGECVRITTGAPMPAGADTVGMREDTSVNGSSISLRPGVRMGANVRKAGEDAQPGDLVLRAGTLLNAVHVSLAAFITARPAMANTASATMTSSSVMPRALAGPPAGVTLRTPSPPALVPVTLLPLRLAAGRGDRTRPL